jgi:threonine aldolase
MATRFFASDNSATVHPAVMDSLASANHGHAVAYGADPVTARAEEAFHELFGDEASVYFVYNGTGANVLAISTLLRPYHAVICSDVAHVYEDECGATERFAGSALLTADSRNGKIGPDAIRRFLPWRGVQHHVQPALVTITNTTELGTVYTPEEVAEIAEAAHEAGLYLHMDGARIANAACSIAASRGVGAREALLALTRDAGVDALSFGATKNGIMFGEAVVFFPSAGRVAAAASYSGASAPDAPFPFVRKQGMQLASKMRYVAAQFEALLSGDLWAQNAEHANAMAARLKEGLEKRGLGVAYPVEANGVFAQLPSDLIAELQRRQFFYVWDEPAGIVRLMASFDTEPDDIDTFLEHLDALRGA